MARTRAPGDGKAFEMRASDATDTVAAAPPCTNRAAVTSQSAGAMPDTSEPTANTVRPPT